MSGQDIYYFSKKAKFIALFIGAILLASCNTTRFLDKEKGEVFLSQNKIEFEKTENGNIKNKSNLTYELSKLYKQRPNRKFFGAPRQFFYYAAQDTFDMTKLGKRFANFKYKMFGEEPVILDTSLVYSTESTMQSYLKNKGYLHAEVKQYIRLNKNETKATVTYSVTPGGLYTIDTLFFESKDTAIQRILYDIAPESFLKKGQPLDVKLYQQEVSRITRHLRNNGYAYFYPQYISNLNALESLPEETEPVKLKLEILVPTGKTHHQKYTIGNIYIYPDFDPAAAVQPQPDTLVEGMFFATGGRRMRVRPRTLSNSIYLKTGEVFNQTFLDNSIRQLGSLGVFRPPSVQYVEDPQHEGVLNFEIKLSTTKKWEFGADFDLSNTERKSIGAANLIGLSFNPSLRNRNFMRGAELLVWNMDMGVELAPFTANTPLVNTLDFRLQADLYFPRFVDYLFVWKGLTKLRLNSEKFYQTLRTQATSRLTTSYNYLKLINNYSLQFVNLSYGYEVPLSATKRLSINHFGIDLLLPNIIPGSAFDISLKNEPFLQKSFSSQFITGLLFRDLTYTYTSLPNEAGGSWFFRTYFDLSGLEAMTTNVLYNAISSKPIEPKIINIDLSYYAKLEMEGRRFWNFGNHRNIATRLTAGVAKPYYNSEAVPYIKQFYAGGPYSNRGWYARSLGPGLVHDETDETGGFSRLYFQTGDLKLDLSLEYRFLMVRPFGLFNLYGATFLDAGNIWTLQPDPDRIGSEIAWTRQTNSEGTIIRDNFLREIALGMGYGFRVDFTYFVFRLDLGTPLRNNFPDPARNQSYWVDFSKWKLGNDVVFSLGLGYPF